MIDCGVALAPAMGYGMSEEARHDAPIKIPRGFSLEWMRLAPGAALPRHRLAHKQVVIAKSAGLEIDLEIDQEKAIVPLGAWDTFSIPAGVWRALRNKATADALALVITSGDERKRIEWAPESLMRTGAGWVLDADGFVAPRRIVERASA